MLTLESISLTYLVAFFQGALITKNVKWVWISLSEAGDPFGPMERPLDDTVLTLDFSLTSSFDLRKNKLLVLKGIYQTQGGDLFVLHGFEGNQSFQHISSVCPDEEANAGPPAGGDLVFGWGLLFL